MVCSSQAGAHRSMKVAGVVGESSSRVGVPHITTNSSSKAMLQLRALGLCVAGVCERGTSLTLLEVSLV